MPLLYTFQLHPLPIVSALRRLPVEIERTPSLRHPNSSASGSTVPETITCAVAEIDQSLKRLLQVGH